VSASAQQTHTHLLPEHVRNQRLPSRPMLRQPLLLARIVFSLHALDHARLRVQGA
jgi:hypothetical protein